MRPRLTYANVVSTLALLLVLAGGTAYAVSKIEARDIAAGAIKTSKLRDKAVKTAKLGTGAVTSEKLGDRAVENRNLGQEVPVALAGVETFNQGGGWSIFKWFDRSSDEAPTLERRETGVYHLHFGALEGPDAQFSYYDLMGYVSLSGATGEVTSSWTDCSGGGCLEPVVRTYDSAGNPADRAFVYLLYRADHRAP